jgi:hypothetical protein
MPVTVYLRIGGPVKLNEGAQVEAEVFTGTADMPGIVVKAAHGAEIGRFIVNEIAGYVLHLPRARSATVRRKT